MNSRERALAALNHQEPDRVPLDFGGRHTTLHLYAHESLMRHLGLNGPKPPIRSYHTYLVEPDPQLLTVSNGSRPCSSPSPLAAMSSGSILKRIPISMSGGRSTICPRMAITLTWPECRFRMRRPKPILKVTHGRTPRIVHALQV